MIQLLAMNSRIALPFRLSPLALFFLSVFMAFSLVYLWEFAIEGYILHKDEVESTTDHWEYVITSTTLVAIALIFPLILAYRLERQREDALKRLTDSERRFRGLFHSSVVAKLLVDEESGKIIEANRAAADFFNRDIGRIVGVSLRELEPTIHSEISRMSGSGRFLSFVSITGMDGRSLSVFIWSLRIEGATHYQIIAHDVSVQELKEDDQRLLAAIYSSVSEGILVTDSNGIILSANGAFCRMVGQDEKDLTGKTPRIFKSGRHDGSFYSAMWKGLLENGAWRGEIWNRINNEDVRPYAVSVSAIRDENGSIAKFSAIYFDISEHKELEETLRGQAELDALTGIFNRRKFDELLRIEWGRARRGSQQLSLIMLDIDHFKKFNDTYGHQCGDEALRLAAMAIRESLQRPTDHAARYGGEEFVVILPGAGMEGAFHVAERIRQRVQEKGATETLPLTISAGVAVIADFSIDDCNQLVFQADKALYKSKSDGRNRVTVQNMEL